MPTSLTKADVQKLSTGVFLHFSTPDALSPVFESALQRVELYAPLGSYQQLYAALRRMVECRFEKTEGQPAADELFLNLQNHFASDECQQRHSSNPWARAVIILTMEAFSESAGGGYFSEIRKAYVSSGETFISEAILADVAGLYDEARLSAPGGAAFYFIANILLLLPEPDDLLKSGGNKHPLLAEYFDYVRSLNRLGRGTAQHDVLSELLDELGTPSDQLPDHCRSYLRQMLLDRVTASAGDVRTIGASAFEYPPARGRSLGSWLRGRKGDANGHQAGQSEEEKEVTVVMIGPPGSGKTTLVRQLIRANRKSIELGLGLHLDHSSDGQKNIKVYGQAPPPGTQQMILLNGLLSAAPTRDKRDAAAEAPKKFPFTIFDSRGGAMYADPPVNSPVAAGPDPDDNTGELSEGEKLYFVTAKAHLLVFAIPPEGIAYFTDRVGPGLGTLDVHFSNFVRRVLEVNPNAMIAVAYTKCDEYGVRMGRARRIIEGDVPRDCLDSYARAQAANESDWRAFAAAASRRGEGGESRLIAELLSKTGLLWKAMARNHRHRFLNGYLVSAEPAVDYFAGGLAEEQRSMESLGLLQIFADFFAHLKATSLF